MKIRDATTSALDGLWQRVEPEVAGAACAEEAAQALVSAVQQAFEESVVLARTFLTVPFEQLPSANQGFVRGLAADAAGELKPETLVLSLIGTHGQEAPWNDRRRSEGHVGIPLISSGFVEAIPMIARLLKELGVPLSWVDSRDTDIAERVGESMGLFFVDDAALATDQENRKIIAAQDFVQAYGVKSVFGIGGACGGDHMLVTVLFCRDASSRADAERFTNLMSSFGASARGLLEQGKVFAEA